MPALDEDDRPKKKIAHEIGQDLTLLSVGELEERIRLLQDEIERQALAEGERLGLTGPEVARVATWCGEQTIARRAA